MSIIGWVLFGIIAGVIANMVDPRPSYGGILGAVVLGIVGAFVGGLIGAMLFGVGITGFNLSSFLLAVGGSLLLLMVGRYLGHGRHV
ncbi:MAG: GlsB/YeaQ/YmgE family stress response membrane protein [Candidatus Curtissbacteria bacterium]|nr:GlsB/YeaQ/YmgE family stress response membrane protein [Candidatus Curtissbacteria bacterium]